jgi:hypothetical protein
MPEPQKDPAPANSPTNSPGALAPARRRTGNIARLPKEVCRRINQMMDDGVPYEGIIQALGDNGKDLNVDMLYRWKKGGYQDYLREQRLIEQCVARRAGASALLTKTGQLTGGGLQLVGYKPLSSVASDLEPSNVPSSYLVSKNENSLNFDVDLPPGYALGEYMRMATDAAGNPIASWGDSRNTWVSPADGIYPGPHPKTDVFFVKP